ncbi:MAG: hypothetical protein H0V17_12585, partial [Deltaproteobacteria bacterium]|nr:hypothetical protein [Deltaproteobacteria bacterium]
MSHDLTNWWNADKTKVHGTLMAYVQAVEEEQSAIYDRFVKLEALYDPYATTSDGVDRIGVVENVIAANIDTVAAVVAATDIRARFQTDGADWDMQRTARRLEWYAEELGTRYQIAQKCRTSFKLGGALKGTGLIKVYIDQFDEIRVERVLVDDVIVDEQECKNGGKPKQIHQRMTV